jgi:5-methylcytosine-specific restriction endonuclease McrA
MNDRTDRNCNKSKEWIKEVIERDNYKCQKCGTDKKLVAHHIIEWDKNIDLRINFVQKLSYEASLFITRQRF